MRACRRKSRKFHGIVGNSANCSEISRILTVIRFSEPHINSNNREDYRLHIIVLLFTVYINIRLVRIDATFLSIFFNNRLDLIMESMIILLNYRRLCTYFDQSVP